MRRAALVAVGGYLLIAAGNRVAEHFGAMRRGCAEQCWCRRPGLSLFRWVFPWSHRSSHITDSSHTADEKAELDSTPG